MKMTKATSSSYTNTLKCREASLHGELPEIGLLLGFA